MHILRLSPAAVYDNASAILAGTDLGSIQEFIDQVREHRRSFIGYLSIKSTYDQRIRDG